MLGVPVESYVKPLVHRYCPEVVVSVYFGEVTTETRVNGQIEILSGITYMDIKVGFGAKPEDVKAMACHEVSHVRRGLKKELSFEEYFVEEVYTWRDGIQLARENGVLETYCRAAYLELEEIYGTIDNKDALRTIDEIYKECGL